MTKKIMRELLFYPVILLVAALCLVARAHAATVCSAPPVQLQTAAETEPQRWAGAPPVANRSGPARRVEPAR